MFVIEGNQAVCVQRKMSELFNPNTRYSHWFWKFKSTEWEKCCELFSVIPFQRHDIAVKLKHIP